MVKIPLFLSSDDNYSPFVATTMASILMNTKEFVEFYILDMGITDLNKQKIKNTNRFFKNFTIEFIEINPEKFKKLPTLYYISAAMYSRYLIAELKPEINRAIYSDVDVTFVGDIKSLWDEDLNGFMVGAVPSQRGRLNNNYANYKKKLKLSPEHDFFMSGLLLIDCQQWRQNNMAKKLIDKTLELKDSIELPDQEVLNVIFDNNYKRLSPKYCVIYKIFKECYSKQEIKDLKNNQVIIHYPGDEYSKPWNSKKLNSAEYFWNTVRFTDFEAEIIYLNKRKSKIRNNTFMIKLFKNIFSISKNNDKKIIKILGIKITKKNKNYQYNELKNEITTLKHIINTCIDITKIPPAKGYLRKLQIADTILMEIFHNICKKYNITYWLDYGTLLGAVRHKGFIPWDDDIDLAMLRTDYDKIRDILKKELEQYGFEVNEGKHFFRQITRLIYKSTSVQIDIWPYDYYNKKIIDEKEKEYLENKIKICNKKFFEKYPFKSLNNGTIEFPRKDFNKLQKEIILENMHESEDGAIFGGSEAIVYTNPNIFNKDDIFPLKEVTFEDIQLYIPNKEDNYLTKIYKDYMTFPNFKIFGHENIQDNKNSDIDDILNELIHIRDEVKKSSCKQN